jgi:hypothetical protein
MFSSPSYLEWTTAIEGVSGNTFFFNFASVRENGDLIVFGTYKGIVKIMGHFLLVVHWTMYFYALLLVTYELKYSFYWNDLQQTEWMLATIPFIAFTLIYWNIKNRWAFFPWQHVKPKD